MMNLRLLPLVAACAAAGLAHAAPSQEELARVRAYGTVSVAQDSVNSWGVWEQFEPPAAGPATPSVSLQGSSELYRPLASVTVPTTVAAGLCASGALCGLGLATEMKAFFVDLRPRVQAVLEEEGPSSGPRQSVFSVSPEVLAPVAEQAVAGRLTLATAQALGAGDWQPARMLFRPTTLDGASDTLLPQVSDLTAVSRGEFSTSYEGAEGNLYSDPSVFYYQLSTEDAVATAIMNGMLGYVQGPNPSRASLIGVWGVTTTTAGMEALQRGSVVVNYEGYSYKGSPVSLTVDFGQGRVLGGAINGGADSGKVNSYVAIDGQRYINGPVGLNVLGGTVVGSNFVINQMSANDGTVSGRIQGAFFGSKAEVAAGVVDVVKSRTDGSYTNGRYNDVFYTIDQTKRVNAN